MVHSKSGKSDTKDEFRGTNVRFAGYQRKVRVIQTAWSQVNWSVSWNRLSTEDQVQNRKGG